MIPNKTIFTAPMGDEALIAAERQKKEIASNKKQAWIRVGASALVLVVYSAVFFYPQLNTYLSSGRRLTELRDEIKRQDEVVLPATKKELELHRAAYDQKLEEAERLVDTILPGDPDKHSLIQRLENFAAILSSETPPFEFNAITFGEPATVTNSETKFAVQVLPLSTSIHSSRENFNLFLQFIEKSGRFDSQLPLRLMEITGISLRYRGVNPQTGEDQGVDFSVKMNAYSRPIAS